METNKHKKPNFQGITLTDVDEYLMLRANYRLSEALKSLEWR
jgi:hypothetical protein